MAELGSTDQSKIVYDIQAELAEWYKMKAELNKLKSAESIKRKAIFAQLFPEAIEGTNTYDLPDNYCVKGQRVINRDIDQVELEAMQAAAVQAEAGDFSAMSKEQYELWSALRFDELIRYKPELMVGNYRKLTPEQEHLVDQFLIVKDGSPQMEIKPGAARRTSKKAK